MNPSMSDPAEVIREAAQFADKHIGTHPRFEAALDQLVNSTSVQAFNALQTENAALEAERDQLIKERDELKRECRYEIESGHFVRCPENHGSNGSLYDAVDERDSLRTQLGGLVERGKEHLRYAEESLAQGKRFVVTFGMKDVIDELESIINPKAGT